MEDYCCDDDLAIAPLAELGIDVTSADWRTFDTQRHYDWVIVRSTWDYQRAADKFFSLLGRIDASASALANPLSVMRDNQDKRYLLDLQDQGIAIVPTTVLDSPSTSALRECLDTANGQDIVVKPVVSAGAERTHWLRAGADASVLAAAESDLAGLHVLVQPFLPEIQTDGEYSVFFFNGEYSHSIHKKPKSGDFRVQEEHGGLIHGVAPSGALLDAAKAALASLSEPTLYARVDVVKHRGAWLLMELELIEPSLYLRCDPLAPARFAHACKNYFSARSLANV